MNVLIFLFTLIVLCLTICFIGSKLLNKHNTKNFHIKLNKNGFEISAEYFEQIDQSK